MLTYTDCNPSRPFDASPEADEEGRTGHASSGRGGGGGSNAVTHGTAGLDGVESSSPIPICRREAECGAAQLQSARS